VTPIFPNLMPKKAKKATSSKDALPANTPSSQHAPNASFSFPILQFTSVLGTYTLLLIFVALYLPRSTTLLSSFIPTPAPRPQTSLDRPEHPFLVPLTANPELTLSWVCLGSWVLVAWWGGWVRGWRRSERKEKVAREARTRRKIEVSFSTFLFMEVIFSYLLPHFRRCGTLGSRL
jgi:phosphatidylinositol glycan class F